MKMVKLIVGLLLTINCYCQPTEYSRQLFGNNCYLQFPGSTNIAGSSLSTTEGCASICDGSGNLLFYSDGVKVWNKNHIQMPNGFGLLGNPSTTQSCIIVKKPLSTTQYYIFTAPEAATTNIVCYSVVDISLNSGLGDLIQKNQSLLASNTFFTEKLTFTYHCNGVDVWIITKEKGNSIFKCWRLDSTGIVQWTASLTGYVLTTNLSDNIGCIKVSPSGDLLAVCHYGVNRVYLYDFNNVTGIISNERLLSSTIAGPYGCEFSSNSQYLYVGYNSGSFIHRYDVTNINPQTTRTAIASGVGNFCGTFQRIGNTIYIAQATTTYLDAITNIDGGGIFNQNYILTIGTVRFGLNQILYPINQQLPIITTN